MSDFLPFAGVLLLSPLLLSYLFPVESHLRAVTSWMLSKAHPPKLVEDYLSNAKGLLQDGFAKVGLSPSCLVSHVNKNE